MNQQGTPREDHGASPGIGQAITTYEAERPDSAAPSATSSVRRRNTVRKEQEELAGGIEDWKGIRVGDVDRYGFIHETRNAPVQSIQRVSTSLLLASTSPRSRRRLSRNSFASTNAPNTPSSPGIHRTTSRTPSLAFARPLSSQSGYRLPFTKGRSGIRYPRRARKCINEAADMLTLPRADVEDENSPYAMAMKRREWRREDKWQRMAEVCKSQRGGGMTFRFDMKSSKLIERTWKGIPDRWRAVAWHSFLSQSAERRKDCQSDEELTQLFHELQEVSSADDVQIDLDVPRTISSHIMFRRRYRGGQRLLFRVLHAMSLHFPQTGYVQGMAALAATLLAYYDEEQAFIMLVRLWQVRGLDRLYRSGFAGLMEALDDFERHWLCGGEIAEKLNALGIPPTSYGTRWYLTLFNYAIPFPAQLRVWDVFMLLGDSGGPDDHATNSAHGDNPSPFGNSLDVLHAVSASLIDGMRDIILQSDFENAMKVLTSWVPIKDVELFMRVAKVEYKVHANKARESALRSRGR
ncbi:hypothetical protein KEM55_002226 [Ascosphaera atra]|nr:hypothetical protein KEM55_002226 [Ascosphaera atra]